jgi:hypothetical protein
MRSNLLSVLSCFISKVQFFIPIWIKQDNRDLFMQGRTSLALWLSKIAEKLKNYCTTGAECA